MHLPAPDVTHDLHVTESEEEQAAREGGSWWPVRLAELLGGLVVCLLALGITTGIVLRATGHGVTGIVELAAASMLVIVVLGAPALSYLDEHVRLELVDLFVKPRGLRWLNLFSDVFQLAVVTVIVYAAYDLFMGDLQSGTTMGGELDLARSYISGVTVVGFTLVGVVLVRKIYRDARRAGKGSNDQ